MSETTTTCVMGCTLTGQHVTDCPRLTCRGCLPRPADVGWLCQWHYNRLETAVGTFNAFRDWLNEADDADAHGKPLTDDRRAHGDPAETVPITASRLAADELWNDLAGWARVVREEHPTHLRGWERKPWLGDVASWLLPHLPWAAEQMWIDELAGLWVSAIATARHRWPTAEDVEPVKHLDVPCPRCGLRSLIYTPARWAGQAFRVECTDPDCARVFSEDEWDRFRHLAESRGLA